jgi:hypothetical protein
MLGIIGICVGFSIEYEQGLNQNENSGVKLHVAGQIKEGVFGKILPKNGKNS